MGSVHAFRPCCPISSALVDCVRHWSSDHSKVRLIFFAPPSISRHVSFIGNTPRISPLVRPLPSRESPVDSSRSLNVLSLTTARRIITKQTAMLAEYMVLLVSKRLLVSVRHRVCMSFSAFSSQFTYHDARPRILEWCSCAPQQYVCFWWHHSFISTWLS